MSGYETLIRAALAEDLVNGVDITTDNFIRPGVIGKGWIEAREDGILSGLEVAKEVFKIMDEALDIQLVVKEGTRVRRGEHVLEAKGNLSSVLKAERTALNFLCHLSGVASITYKYVEAVKECGTQILCTRKTTPCLRSLEIAAVKHGGGNAYRTNLSDSILLKDNHIGILGGASSVKSRLDELAKQGQVNVKHLIEGGKIEVSTIDEVNEAVEMGWRQILLDNMAPREVRVAVDQWGKRIFLEVSGGVNLTNIKDYAATGVHAISIGAITHSSPAMDFSLEVEWRR